MASGTKGSTSFSYGYNSDGLRTKKIVGSQTYTYYWNGTQLAAMTITTGSNVSTLRFYYDAEGTPFYFDYNGTKYFYITNLQGDVVGLSTSDGIVAYYEYDAWGRILSINSASSNEYSALTYNPLRYRGYIYDTETGFYYLQSRYYDPAIRRFISADGQIGNDLLGANLFVYCGNNPVARKDNNGQFGVLANAFVGGIIGGVSKIASNIRTNQKWNTGLAGAIAGGATYNAMLATTGSIALAGVSSAAAESTVNEVCSYIPIISEFNGSERKELSIENVSQSAEKAVNDTFYNGVLNTFTGYVSTALVPNNSSLGIPKRFIDCFIGASGARSILQTGVQAAITIIYNDLTDSMNVEQESLFEIYP